MRSKKSLKIRIAVCMFAVMMLATSGSVMAVTMTKGVTLPKNGNEVTICSSSYFYQGTVQIQASKVASGSISKEHPIYFTLRAQNGDALCARAPMSSVPTSLVLTPSKRVAWRLVGSYPHPDASSNVTIGLNIAY